VLAWKLASVVLQNLVPFTARSLEGRGVPFLTKLQSGAETPARRISRSIERTVAQSFFAFLCMLQGSHPVQRAWAVCLSTNQTGAQVRYYQACQAFDMVLPGMQA
jgi:hypothetical protein